MSEVCNLIKNIKWLFFDAGSTLVNESVAYENYALQNGADLDYGNVRAKMFDAKCPDECRVCIRGEIIED